jgi:DNA invertase Pin-like site-specific DNA recombinase
LPASARKAGRWSATPTTTAASPAARWKRPGLQQLLADIEEGLVDVVVVYKIDRLSRSLMDFSKLVEVFDRAGVTFVSVTQSFNTTTSMGRLRLNILLSFAQFEREVIAERVRDKIRAYRQKGMWMGGSVPLGYVVRNRKLLVHEPDAAVVRSRFERFLRLGSPTHTRKGNRLYRYYVSQDVLQRGRDACPVGRVPAAEIEVAVIDQPRGVFRQPEIVIGTWRAARAERGDVTEDEAREALLQLDLLWDELFPAEQARIVQVLVERVDVRTLGVEVRLRPNGLAGLVRETNGNRRAAVRADVERQAVVKVAIGLRSRFL